MTSICVNCKERCIEEMHKYCPSCGIRIMLSTDISYSAVIKTPIEIRVDRLEEWAKLLGFRK
jgi:hypothetical protein